MSCMISRQSLFLLPLAAVVFFGIITFPFSPLSVVVPPRLDVFSAYSETVSAYLPAWIDLISVRHGESFPPPIAETVSILVSPRLFLPPDSSSLPTIYAIQRVP